MNIEITIPSSTSNSDQKLVVTKFSDNEEMVISLGEETIFILTSHLKKALMIYGV